MIKLFVSDLDGCISHPFKTPSWEAINKLRELNILSRSQTEIPPLTLCTGRPFPYAEAVAQWLDIRLPFVFESAGLFFWDGFRIETALSGLDGTLTPIIEMKRWLQKEVLPKYPEAILEFTKMMDAGIVCADEDIVNDIHGLVLKKVSESFPDMEVHTTEVSVNILMPGNDKLQGIKLIGNALDIELDEMAFIGDSSGDVPALKNVKMPFAPANARQIAKEHAEVLSGTTTDAVVEAYEKIIAYNLELV